MQIKTVLFDLDNTLLVNNMDAFLPRYFAGLGKHVRHLPKGERWIEGLLAATRIIVDTDHPNQTNEEIFWDYMEQALGIDRESAEFSLTDFHTNVFPKIADVTTPVPGAKRAIDLCFERGLKVGIATNPLFPCEAIYERLRWANVPPEDYDFALITTYEIMCAAKPSLAYYRQILAMLDADPAATLMVGDNWTNDIEPASALGMPTYWIPTDRLPEPIDPDLPTASGSLEQFCDWILSES